MEHGKLVSTLEIDRFGTMRTKGHVVPCDPRHRDAPDDHGRNHHHRHDPCVLRRELDRDTAVPHQKSWDVSFADRVHGEQVARTGTHFGDSPPHRRVHAVIVPRGKINHRELPAEVAAHRRVAGEQICGAVEAPLDGDFAVLLHRARRVETPIGGRDEAVAGVGDRSHAFAQRPREEGVEALVGAVAVQWLGLVEVDVVGAYVSAHGDSGHPRGKLQIDESTHRTCDPRTR